jgi:hypothetical protein
MKLAEHILSYQASARYVEADFSRARGGRAFPSKFRILARKSFHDGRASQSAWLHASTNYPPIHQVKSGLFRSDLIPRRARKSAVSVGRRDFAAIRPRARVFFEEEP